MMILKTNKFKNNAKINKFSGSSETFNILTKDYIINLVNEKIKLDEKNCK